MTAWARRNISIDTLTCPSPHLLLDPHMNSFPLAIHLDRLVFFSTMTHLIAIVWTGTEVKIYLDGDEKSTTVGRVNIPPPQNIGQYDLLGADTVFMHSTSACSRSVSVKKIWQHPSSRSMP